ncbi:MAG: NTE family protein [Cyclobacteriaceae bacterium]|jgi:NTE family protein
MGQKVALVLSSGGARGLAHIGVIQGLLANGYEITSISGSSMGAVVGAFYAAGKLEVYHEWALELDRYDIFKLLDFSFSTQGFLRGEKVFKELEKVIDDIKIEDMPISFRAMATDIINKKEVIFEKGSMYDAIKASVAIPTVIRPVPFEDTNLVDGAVINPIPISCVKRHEGDILVVSNVNAMIPYTPPKQTQAEMEKAESYQKKIQNFVEKWAKMIPGNNEPKKKLGYFDLMTRSIELMQDRLTSLILEKYNPEIRIDISREVCTTFEFYKAEQVIAEGRRSLEESLLKISKYS